MIDNGNPLGEEAEDQNLEAQPESDASAQQETAEASAAEEAAAEESGAAGLLGKVTGMLPEGALGKASSLLDQDGDGNPLNDIAGLAGKFLGR